MKVLRVFKDIVVVVGEASSFQRLIAEELLDTKECGASTYQGYIAWCRDDEKHAVQRAQHNPRLTDYYRRCLAGEPLDAAWLLIKLPSGRYPYVVLQAGHLYRAANTITGWRGPTHDTEAEATADALLEHARHSSENKSQINVDN